MIKDVVITSLRKIPDERGSIAHMLRSDAKHFIKFGEIYFSTVTKNGIKAWHLHKEATLNYVCVKGAVKLVLFDDRSLSSTKGKYQEFILSPKNYFLITIPPNIWNGFKNLDNEESIIANCLNIPHNEKEMVRENHDSENFNFDWSK